MFGDVINRGKEKVLEYRFNSKLRQFPEHNRPPAEVEQTALSLAKYAREHDFEVQLSSMIVSNDPVKVEFWIDKER